MKRYPKYKDSGIQWLGQIPEHWDEKRLASLFTDDVVANSDFAYKHAYKFYYGTLVPKGEVGNEEEYRETYVKYSVLKKNDIVLNGLNLNYDFVSQRVAIAPADGIITSAYLVARPRKTTFADYYLYVFKTMDNMKMFHGMGTGIRLTLSFAELKKQMLPFPPLPEQEKIVEYIDSKTNKIDAYVAERERELQALTELKQSQIAEVVTRGLNPDAPLKDSGIPWIGMIPEHWENKQLRAFLKLFTEKGHGDAQLLSVTREQGVILRDKDNKEENHNFVPEDLSGYKYVEKGDFVVNKMKAWQGSYAVSKHDGIVSPAYYTCKLKGVDEDFFSLAIRSKVYVSFFASYSKGIRVGQWDLEPNALKAIPFFLPPIKEQKAIVEFVNTKRDHIDTMIANLESEIAYLKEYKQRLIADAVTGAINVQ